jgi:hypothetical protein
MGGALSLAQSILRIHDEWMRLPSDLHRCMHRVVFQVRKIVVRANNRTWDALLTQARRVERIRRVERVEEDRQNIEKVGRKERPIAAAIKSATLALDAALDAFVTVEEKKAGEQNSQPKYWRLTSLKALDEYQRPISKS